MFKVTISETTTRWINAHQVQSIQGLQHGGTIIHLIGETMQVREDEQHILGCLAKVFPIVEL